MDPTKTNGNDHDHFDHGKTAGLLLMPPTHLGIVRVDIPIGNVISPRRLFVRYAAPIVVHLACLRR